MKGSVMTDTNVPVFSTFRRLRMTNPDAYYTAQTQRQMFYAQQRLGSAFYDLMSREGYSL